MARLQKRVRLQKRRGAKPRGENGGRVRDYPQVTLRLPPAAKYQLETLSTLRGVPMWRLIETAIHGLVEALPRDERHWVIQMATRRANAHPGRS